METSYEIGAAGNPREAGRPRNRRTRVIASPRRPSRSGRSLRSEVAPGIPRTAPSRRTTVMVVVIAVVLAALSVYTMWATRQTVTPADRTGTGYSRVH